MTILQKKYTFGAKQCVTADPAKYPQAAFKANSFATGLGPNEGVGYILLRKIDLDALDPNAGLAFRIETEGESTSSGDTQTGAIDIVGLFIDHGVKVGSGANDDPNSVQLVRVVDKRFQLMRWTVTARQFNQRMWAGGETVSPGTNELYVRGTSSDPETPFTLPEIVERLWDDLPGLAGAFPTMPTSANSVPPPENLHFIGQNCWVALHTVLHQSGYTTALDPSTGEFTIVELGGAQDLTGLNLDNGLYDAERFNGGATFAPETIAVYFPRMREDYGTERDTESNDNHIVSEAFHVVPIATGAAGAVPGSVLPVWDSLRAFQEHAATSVSNVSDLEIRANVVAQGWLQNHAQNAASAPAADRTSGDRVHRLISGAVFEAKPGAKIKAVMFRDFGKPEGGQGDGLVTEILRHPGFPVPATYYEGGGGTGLRSFKGMGFTWDDRDEVEAQRSLDFARPTFPNYPRLPNIVQIVGFNLETSCCFTPSEGGDAKPWALPLDPSKKLYGGVVHRYNSAASGLESLEPCWVRIANVPDLKEVFKAEPNGYFYARLSGVETFNEKKLPLYTTVSHARAGASWQFGCVDMPVSPVHAEYSDGQGACDVQSVQVDKQSSLALYRAPAAGPGCDRIVGLAFKGGPEKSVMTTPGAEPVARWNQSPITRTMGLQDGLELGETGSSTWLLPGGTPLKYRFPNEAPEASAHLIVDGVSGECVQLKWSQPGLTAGAVQVLKSIDCMIVDGYPGAYIICEPTFCEVSASRGVVVQFCDEGEIEEGDAPVCVIEHQDPFDPCA